MNDLSTVKPLYPLAFPQPDADESDALYPKAPLNQILGFDLEIFQTPLDELMPSKKVPDGVMTTRNFKQIVSSIREIGLTEPLSVIKPGSDAASFFVGRQLAGSCAEGTGPRHCALPDCQGF